VDYEHVAIDIAEILAGLDVHAIAFDRWRMDVLQRELERLGLSLPLQPFGQSFFVFVVFV
jgi:phage terminase large subunit-like protein